MRSISQDHQLLIGGNFKEHVNSIKEKMEHNQQILKYIVNYGAGMFGEDHTKAIRMHQNRRPTNEFNSKVLSTLRQICREWSSEGEPERTATFLPIVEELNRIYPKNVSARHEIRILVPGCGLGRLAHDLIDEGYSVQGNEFSFFMLLTSFFILNACKEVNQYTIYPFIFEKSNCWRYEDRLRPVSFPDKLLRAQQSSRSNSFSMCAGDFLDIAKGASFSVVVTAWFIDTAHNVIEYIDAIFNCLPCGDHAAHYIEGL
ncbi:unnamed protein product [Caenorhabditis sp. 36 PRJEB53466]|nr:unnamed protein product [Caenorhabditis sp. 36 PRJEB53466]